MGNDRGFFSKPVSSAGAPSDSFVTKINSAAFSKATLVYSTYPGGTIGSSFGSEINDNALSIAVDLRGNIYVTG